MPNLVGLHDPTASREELERTLGRMMDAVDLPAFRFQRRSIVDGPMACGNVLPGMEDNASQPVFDRERGLWLMLDGELLGVRELVARLRRAGVDAEGKDDAKLALAAYVAFGQGFLEHLNGNWNLVLRDAAEDSTLVITDRLGSRLLFCAEDGPRFVFSTELKGVVAGRKVKTRPGGVALFGLLSAGMHHGDGVWLEGLKLVPAGTVVRLGATRRTSTRYWKMRFHEGGPEMSEADYADGFARHLRAATERSMKLSGRQRFALTLSGGLDSRAVALSLDRGHLPLTAITYGDEESADVRYARQLAQVIGLDHYYIEPERERLVADSERIYNQLTGSSGPQGFFSAQLDRIIWRCEALALFDGLSSPLWHPIYRQKMRFMLNGAAGDAMTGSHLTPNLLLAPTRAQLIDDFYRRRFPQSPELLRQVLTPRFYEENATRLRPVFAEGFDDIDADDPLAIANVWDMENRQRRGAFTSFTMERYFCNCRSPFLDYELVDFLTRVPGRWRFQQRIYKRMLVTAFPEARHVPWAYTEGRITTSPAFEFTREAFNWGRAKAKKLLPWEKNKPDRWAFRDPVKMMREDQALHERLVAFTRSEHFPSDIFDARGVAALVDDFAREGGGLRHVMFTNLLGIARAMELFLVPDEIRVPPSADPAAFGVATSD